MAVGNHPAGRGIVRLVSPTRSRIYAPTVDGEPTPEAVKAALTRAKHAAATLIAAGWRVYDGPAETNARGWVIDGTDPTLVPIPPSTVYKGVHGRG